MKQTGSFPFHTAPEGTNEISPAEQANAAGVFSNWLENALRGQRKKTAGASGADVPCAACNACCRSSQFIHVRPDEVETRRRIPSELLFAAPGLPKGHMLMGYNEKGECPMLIENACSIYAHRPQTCRDYDCRIFAATGIALEDRSHADIAARAKDWKFSPPSDTDRDAFAALRAAVKFFSEKRNLFPPRAIPTSATPLAVRAIRAADIFLKLENPAPADEKIVRRICAQDEKS